MPSPPYLENPGFNIYGKSGASADADTLKFNDDLLKDIFQIVAQFGDIPVLVVGDFQLPPLQYPSVAAAVHFGNWFDPLTSYLEDGSANRPLTYSRDCTFSGPGDHSSSIDGMLLNQVAFNCLQSIDTVEWFQKQHRPTRACFQWDTTFLVGPVHVKFAPFDTSQVVKPSCPFDYVPQPEKWDHTLREKFDCGPPRISGPSLIILPSLPSNEGQPHQSSNISNTVRGRFPLGQQLPFAFPGCITLERKNLTFKPKSPRQGFDRCRM